MEGEEEGATRGAWLLPLVRAGVEGEEEGERERAGEGAEVVVAHQREAPARRRHPAAYPHHHVACLLWVCRPPSPPPLQSVAWECDL